ncbi:MAG: SAM-dependent methyltransferase [Pseudomonadota bacterium]
MVSRSAHADDIAMKGEGYYSLATKGAKDVIDGAAPLVESALDAMASEGHLQNTQRPFCMADMGCADGGTSLAMVGAALTKVQALVPKRPLTMVYSDQTFNDYNALFRIVHGHTTIESHLPRIEGLHVFASATSFYQQALPAGSLDLGFSATAMHWLSRKPMDISNHVHATGAQGAELAAFADQGRRDWETILQHRAAELAPGGRLVLVNFCRDEAGRYLGNTSGKNMFSILNDLWVGSMDDGTITSDEYRAMTLPQYYKDLEEFTAPLQNRDNAIAGAGLRLEEAFTRVVPCPFAKEFAEGGGKDPTEFAKSYIPTIRSWNESIFFAGLSPARPREERQEIIDDYYGRYEQLVREAPQQHRMDYVHAYLVIRKEA